MEEIDKCFSISNRSVMIHAQKMWNIEETLLQ